MKTESPRHRESKSWYRPPPLERDLAKTFAVTSEKNFGCNGNTIRTASGIYFDFAAPTAEMICLTDIARGLANECRFARQSPRFYSVAEHSMQCAAVAFERGLRMEVVQAVFCHDFAEAYTGDIPKPLKIMLGELGPIEDAINQAIEEKFGVNLLDPIIKQIDHQMLIAERNAIFQRDGVLWSGEELVEPLSIAPACYGPAEAFEHFLALAKELGLPVD